MSSMQPLIRKIVLESRFICFIQGCNCKDALAPEQPAPVPIQHQEGLLGLLIWGSANSKTVNQRTHVVPFTSGSLVRTLLSSLSFEKVMFFSTDIANVIMLILVIGVSFPWSPSLPLVLGKTEMQLGTYIAVHWLSMESWHIPHMVSIFALEKS